MPALTAQHLSKSFGSRLVLDDATFTLGRGEKVGLIGANGAGKSTLAKVLAGMEAPDGGTVSVRRGLSVRYLAQEPELDASKTARDVVEDALTAWREATTRHAEITAKLGDPAHGSEHRELVTVQAELDEAVARLGGWERGHEALGFLHRLGVRDVDRPCGDRSGGERRRIALAQLLVASPDVAVLDEPTNHLDADTAAWLETFLAEDFPGAILLVTHDRYFLDAVAERIVELERGRLTGFPGGYGGYLAKKAELLEHEDRVEQNRQNALRREREWLARGPKARSTKQKARIARAVSLEAETPATAGRPGQATLAAASTSREGKTVLEAMALQVAPAEGAPALNAPFDLVVQSGDRIGVVGPNGVGKTTLVRAILDAFAGNGSGVASGSIKVGKNTRVAYLDQAREGLDDDKSVFDDVRGEGGSTAVNLGAETMDLRSYLELFLFDGHAQRQKVGSLSGGERARVALAKTLRQGANLLVFDEPTNDLDLGTLAALEELLRTYRGSVLCVTHDRAFLDRVATSILAFERAPESALARVTRYAGGYTDYISQRKDATTIRPVPAPRPAAGPAEELARARAKPGLTYAERIELETIVDAIDAAEKRVAEVEALLADTSLYAKRGADVASLRSSLQAAKADAAALIARWEALESKKVS